MQLRFVMALGIAAAIVAAIAIGSIAHFGLGIHPDTIRVDAFLAIAVVATALAGGTIIGRWRGD
jgi:hypothetical protein